MQKSQEINFSLYITPQESKRVHHTCLTTRAVSKGQYNFTIQFSSVAQSCLTLCDPMDCSMPGLHDHHQLQSLPKLMSKELVMSSNHLILYHTLLLLPSILPIIRVFSNESALPSGGQNGVSASTSVLPMNIQD